MALEKAGLLDDPQNLQEMKIREPIGREYLPQVIKNIKGSGPQVSAILLLYLSLFYPQVSLTL